jgi:DNA-binding transcriptional MerR regulator
MNIGELARATETKAEAIRYYERIGLLPAPPRTAGNYRDYSAAHVSRLTFARRARDLGFYRFGRCSILPTRKSSPAKPWTPSPANIWRT